MLSFMYLHFNINSVSHVCSIFVIMSGIKKIIIKSLGYIDDNW